MTGIDWTDAENEAIVADYFAMLEKDLRGDPVNKAEHNRNLRRSFLPTRSKGSVEYKHQNISAVLCEIGYDYLDGYRPAYNIQDSLRAAVKSRAAAQPELSALISGIVERPAEVQKQSDTELVLVPVPSLKEHKKAVHEWGAQGGMPRVVDFAAVEARNRSVGLAGEHAVLSFEHKRLWTSGCRKLAERIEHVSITRGDGLGFDILSFEETGRERLIEVKTTRFAARTSFFVSRNEFEVSNVRKEEYQLYRLFRFDRKPQLFILPGAIQETCRYDAHVYRAEVADERPQVSH